MVSIRKSSLLSCLDLGPCTLHPHGLEDVLSIWVNRAGSVVMHVITVPRSWQTNKFVEVRVRPDLMQICSVS